MRNRHLTQLELIFSALSDGTRLRIINLLRENEVSVQTMERILNEPQPKISRHLAFLRKADIVSTRRDGKWIYYSLNREMDQKSRELIHQVGRNLATDTLLNQEYQELHSNSDVSLHKNKSTSKKSNRPRKRDDEDDTIDTFLL